MELTTVSESTAVLHDGARVVRVEGLAPDREHTVEGVRFRTLPRPPGLLLCKVATVSDLHLGETECGRYEGVDLGPPLKAGPGEPPYPETMARAAAAEMVDAGVEVVVAKGDLTASAAPEQLEAFFDALGPLGDRLHWTNGNHDVGPPEGPGHTPPPVGRPATELIEVPGARLAVLDTAVAGQTGGRVSEEQLAWLDDLGADADGSGPVLVFGHHPLYDHAAFTAGLDADDSDRLVEVFARRPALVGYFAGHSHRNFVRRLEPTGAVPWAEVGATKDFPGVWAEYRIFEGGVLQVVHRISAPEALAWTERTRAMFGGLYPSYSFGAIGDRCYRVA